MRVDLSPEAQQYGAAAWESPALIAHVCALLSVRSCVGCLDEHGPFEGPLRGCNLKRHMQLQ